MTRGWEIAKLKELVSFVIGGDWGKAPDFEHTDYVDVLCIRGTELRDWHTQRGKTAAPRRIKANSLQKRQLSEGDLILEVSGGGPEQPVGRVELIDKQALAHNAELPRICTNFFRKLEIVGEIDAAFLTRYLKFFYATGEVRKYQAGSNNLRNLKYPEYETIEVPIPPLAEQQRIVEKIETLFARLDKGEEAVREVQKLLTRYRQSVLKSAVTGQLTADWRAEREDELEDGETLLLQILDSRQASWPAKGKYKQPVDPDLGEFETEIPSGWVWTSVDQILRAGLSNGRSVPDAEGQGFPVMRLTALKDGVVDISERKQGAWTAEVAEPFLVEKGDILVSRGNGSKQLVGRGGLIADEVDPVAYPDTMIRIPIDLEHLSPEWFVQLWNSPFMRAQIEKAAKTTAGIYKINQSDIRGFVVPLPPLEEQKQIAVVVAEAISKTVDLERWCETELKRSASLRQSILKDAFAGHLVPQDPTDEPARALLARIADAKAKPKSGVKTTRKKASA